MQRSLIGCRLAMLASQQAAKQGDDGLLRAYQPLTEAAGAIDTKPIWRATSAEALQFPEGGTRVIPYPKTKLHYTTLA
jgi:hypothetical protein